MRMQLKIWVWLLRKDFITVAFIIGCAGNTFDPTSAEAKNTVVINKNAVLKQKSLHKEQLTLSITILEKLFVCWPGQVIIYGQERSTKTCLPDKLSKSSIVLST